MRPFHALLCIPVALALIPLASLARGRPQDPDKPRQKAPGLTSLVDEKRERLEKELDGVWMLVSFDPGEGFFDSRNVQGVLMISDGYLSLNVMAEQLARELFGPEVMLFLQGGAYRYRIDEFARMQTASIMSYHNFEDFREFVVEPSGTPREFMVDLDESGEMLKLIKPDRSILSFVKLGETQFPEDALNTLNRAREEAEKEEKPDED